MNFDNVLRLTLNFLTFQKHIIQEFHRSFVFFTFYPKITFTHFEIYIILVCLCTSSPKIYIIFVVILLEEFFHLELPLFHHIFFIRIFLRFIIRWIIGLKSFEQTSRYLFFGWWCLLILLSAKSQILFSFGSFVLIKFLFMNLEDTS